MPTTELSNPMLDTIYNLLNSIPPWAYIAVVMPFFVMLPTVGLSTLLERKVASWVQDRLGPNRAGHKLPFFDNVPKFLWKPLSLLQVGADGLKFFLKEDYRAKNVDKILFSLAPAVMIIIVMAAVAIIPWAGIKGDRTTVTVPAGQTPRSVIDPNLPKWHYVVGEPVLTPHANAPDIKPYVVPLDTKVEAATEVTYSHGWRAQIAHLDIGVLFAMSVLSLAVYGVVIGGWASNNKYSFLGGLRATANMISYEIPLGLSILAVVVLFGTLDLQALIERQTHYWVGIIPAWNIFAMPGVFLLLLICLHAESNRAPFDIAEAEQELVGGYHTEYSSMRFALFFLAEYFEMLVTSSIAVALFFGGWHVPYLDKVFPALAGGLDPNNPGLTNSWIVLLVQWGVFYAKVIGLIFIFMWTRWSLPRFRFDQIMNMAWQGLIPMSLALMAVSTVTLWAFGSHDRIHGSAGKLGILPAPMALALLVGNIVVLVGTVVIYRTIQGDDNKRIPNKRIHIAGSRFNNTPVPASTASAR